MSESVGLADRAAADVNIYICAIILAGGAILQASLAPHMAIIGVKPNFVLPLVVAWSVVRGSSEGVVWGFVGGLLLDLLSGGPVGISALTLTLVGFATNLGENAVFKSSLVLPLLTVFVASLFNDAGQILLLQALGWQLDWTRAMAQVALPTAILNAVVMPFVYVPLHWLSRRTAGEGQLQW